MTDAEFLGSLRERATSPELVLPRADYLRLLHLAGREDGHYLASLDERDQVDLVGSMVSLFVELATERLDPAPSQAETVRGPNTAASERVVPSLPEPLDPSVKG